MALAQLCIHSSSQMPLLRIGTVQKQSGLLWEILTDEGRLIKATLSADAVIFPQPGSKVITLYHAEHSYILNVLTQPASTLKLHANTIELTSQTLLLKNQHMEIDTKEFKTTARYIFTSAKRICQEMGMLFQKTRSCFLDHQYHKIKAETLTEEVKHLHFQKSGVIAQQADVISTQADKVLIN